MKKILSFVALIILTCGIVSARTTKNSRGGNDWDTSIHTIGFNIPIQSQLWTYKTDKAFGTNFDKKYEVEYDISSVGFNFMYNHLYVKKNHFSRFIDVQIGWTSFKIDEFKFNDVKFNLSDMVDPTELSGFSTRYMFGYGGAPLNLDKVVLAIHGTFGADMKIATAENTKGSLKSEALFLGLSTFIGANVQCSVRLAGSFGLTAGMHMYTNLVGFGVGGWTETNTVTGKEENNKDSSLINPGRFNIDLKFGICFMF